MSSMVIPSVVTDGAQRPLPQVPQMAGRPRSKAAIPGWFRGRPSLPMSACRERLRRIAMPRKISGPNAREATMSGARLKLRLGPRGRGHDGGGAGLRARPIPRESSRADAFDTIAVPRLEDLRAARAARRRRPPRSPPSARASATTAPRMPTANPIPTTCAPCSAITPARPMSSPIRATRRRLRR